MATLEQTKDRLRLVLMEMDKAYLVNTLMDAWRLADRYSAEYNELAEVADNLKKEGEALRKSVDKKPRMIGMLLHELNDIVNAQPDLTLISTTSLDREIEIGLNKGQPYIEVFYDEVP